MSKKNRFDLLIFGAGIAGLSVAYAAHRAGLKTAVYDINQPGSGASGTPMALLNPATGRKAKKTWRAEECLSYTKELLKAAVPYSKTKLYTENGVIRPALDEDLANGMYKTFRQTTWNDGWVEWLSDHEITSRFPGLYCDSGGLWIPEGVTVSMNQFIHALALYLKKQDVQFYFNQTLVQSDWNTFMPENESENIHSDVVIHCKGKEMVCDPNWERLPLHPVKGQTLMLKMTQSLSFNSSISSLGYIAQSTDKDNTIVLGSTYEHHFNYLNPDDEGAKYLIDRLERTLPGIVQKEVYRQGWAGVRVTVPDKKPVVGKHPEIENLYTVCALGSKGLMLGPMLGKLLVENITEEKEIPDMFCINRLL